MAKISKGFVKHERMPKKTSQGTSKKVKRSSMNKHKKRSFKIYNKQGK
jgi:hypothetical protein